MNLFVKKITDGFNNQWWVKIVETVAVTVIIAALCYYVKPNDPFSLQGVFPWVIFAPALIALRYGSWLGFFSDLLIVFAVLFLEPHAILQQTNYWYNLFALLLFTFICGSFSDLWHYQLVGTQQLNAYAKEHLGNLTLSYYMLKISHDRLEQSLVVKPATLRRTFMQLQKLSLAENGEISVEIMNKFMHLLELYCYFSDAAFYMMENDELNTKPFVSVGDVGELNLNDILVRKCFENKNANYFSVNQISELGDSKYMVVAPLKTTANKILGLLVIKNISFWALNNQVLQGLAVLLAYFINEQDAVNNAKLLLNEFPNCPLEFAKAIYKLQDLNKCHKIESLFIAFKFPHSYSEIEDVITKLEKQQRTIDATWLVKQEQQTILLVLKPFTYAELFTQRLREIQQAYSNQGLVAESVVLSQLQPSEQLKQLIKLTKR